MPASNPVQSSPENTGSLLTWILRFGVAACFIGHGMLGVNRTAAWTSYFAVVGIGRDTAMSLMPWVGFLDLTLALSVLLYPVRAVVLYMAAWSVWTALLRPLAGESFWEAVERAGNYGTPLALFFLLRGGKFWWRSSFVETLDHFHYRRLRWVLRLTTVLLLFGHGALHLVVRKALFVTQYNFIGLPGDAIEPWIGAFECVLALVVLFKPTRGLLFGVVLWKLATEALSPIAGSPIWVFIEHGGSYAAPIAFAFLFPRPHPLPVAVPAPAH
jgi:hypothetical protein